MYLIVAALSVMLVMSVLATVSQKTDATKSPPPFSPDLKGKFPPPFNPDSIIPPPFKSDRIIATYQSPPFNPDSPLFEPWREGQPPAPD